MLLVISNKFLSNLFLTITLVIFKALATEIDPIFDALRDTVLLLTTRQNRNNPFRLLFRNQASLDASPYNPARPTRVLSIKNLKKIFYEESKFY